MPGGIGLESVPYPLAFGERIPGQEVMQIVVALTHQHGPETGLLDAVLVPDFQGLLLEPLEQRRQAAGDAGIDALFVDHWVLGIGGDEGPLTLKRRRKNATVARAAGATPCYVVRGNQNR